MGYDMDIPYDLPYYIYIYLSLVGGLEHYFYDFPYIGKNDPNWLSYFSEGLFYHQPKTQKISFIARLANELVHTSCWHLASVGEHPGKHIL